MCSSDLDIYGFPVAVDYFSDTTIYWNNVQQLVAQFTAAVTTTATATTGDVRGTYALQTSSNGTLLFAASQSPLIPAVNSAIGLYGVPQYTAW